MPFGMPKCLSARGSLSLRSAAVGLLRTRLAPALPLLRLLAAARRGAGGEDLVHALLEAADALVQRPLELLHLALELLLRLAQLASHRLPDLAADLEDMLSRRVPLLLGHGQGHGRHLATHHLLHLLRRKTPPLDRSRSGLGARGLFQAPGCCFQALDHGTQQVLDARLADAGLRVIHVLGAQECLMEAFLQAAHLRAQDAPDLDFEHCRLIGLRWLVQFGACDRLDGVRRTRDLLLCGCQHVHDHQALPANICHALLLTSHSLFEHFDCGLILAGNGAHVLVQHLAQIARGHLANVGQLCRDPIQLAIQPTLGLYGVAGSELLVRVHLAGHVLLALLHLRQHCQ
mmetsp:Transcript_57918/g.104022  ORF Transcript_57918/g.104022 Transcript_57918/m.104022 type:complete len:345 (+) Transcript_57918:181-1215(+)